MPIHIKLWIPKDDAGAEEMIDVPPVRAFVLAGIDERGRMYTNAVAAQANILMMLSMLRIEYVDLPQQEGLLKAIAMRSQKQAATQLSVAPDLSAEALGKLAEDMRRQQGKV